jgi:DNA-binding MarR family transcriptional regulator
MQARTGTDYAALADFRWEIRKFLRFSEHAAREAGIEPQMHQLLLVLRALPDQEARTLAAVAERLQIRHHSAGGLVDRAEAQGLAVRQPSLGDRREVRIAITSAGRRVLARLSRAHRAELESVGPDLVAALDRILRGASPPRSVSHGTIRGAESNA